jgi:hypothetical protein
MASFNDSTQSSLSSSSNSLVKSFSDLVLSLETETKLLKCLLNLRDVSLQEREKSHEGKGHERGEDVRQKLEKIEGHVENLERDLMNFEEFLDSELQIVEEIEEMNQKSIQQQNEIQTLTMNLPVFFQKENILSEKTNNFSTATSNASDIFIELQEFESVPKSTRGRLTLEQAIESLESIRRLLDKKSEVIFLSQLCNSIIPENIFHTESEISCSNYRLRSLTFSSLFFIQFVGISIPSSRGPSEQIIFD